MLIYILKNRNEIQKAQRGNVAMLIGKVYKQKKISRTFHK